MRRHELKLEGYDIRHNRIVINIADCPMSVNKAFTALVGVKNSLFVLTDTIVRKDEESNVAEGDLVFLRNGNKFLGTVIYNKQFLIQTRQGTVEKLVLGRHILMRRGTEDSCREAVSSENRQPIRYCYKGTSYPFDILLSKVGDSLVMYGVSEMVDVNQILIDTGFKVDNCDVGYGSVWNGGIIKLKNLEPCIVYENGDFEKLNIVE